jgi:AmmeMemoRadiSam system protein B/AmmeMemoRadiSam system protein A
MSLIRNPAVAGSFYPNRPDQLAGMVRALLDAVPPWTGPPPKALIVPHAGYIYSGPTAAAAYARLLPLRTQIRRVVVLGPSHRLAFHGIATSQTESWRTPLGEVPLDRTTVDRLLTLPGVVALEAAHSHEHSLEVHLPFLQTVLKEFLLVPLVAGDAPAEQVARVLDAVWGGDETLIVVSSDLSHYLDQASARALDSLTCDAIERLDGPAIGPEQACGQVPIRGLLAVARQRHLLVDTIDLRNSGDTAGPHDRVVGYGAWAFSAPPAEGPAKTSDTEADPGADPIGEDGRLLLQIARDNIRHALRDGARRGERVLPAVLPETLQQDGAAFVTLKRQGALRGCIGSPLAWRSLAVDVADNAVKAALEDPRFPPLLPAELEDLDLSVSVLTPPVPMTIADEADLLAQLRPGIDGLIIEDGGHRALFLPSVWEQLPDPREFLGHLKRKAGLSPHHWSPGFRAQRFQAVEVKEQA